ncbi:MAG TPA: hypothetical protein PK737_02070 [Bacilli bacterium]|nr:hypothetical protein [Bacilli bacterium]
MKVNNEKKKNKVRKTRVIIGSIALAVIALTGILFYVTTSPRFIFGALLDKYYKGFSWALNNVSGNDFDINFATEPVIAKGSFNADIESADVEFVNQVSNFDFNYDIGLDLKNRKAEAGLGVSFSGAKLIDILAGYKDNQLLVALTGSQKVGKIFDKNLKMDLNDIEKSIPFEMITSYIKAFRNSKMTTEDSQYIVKSIKDLIDGSLTDVDFEDPVKETITIDGSEFEATKYTLALNNENSKVILNHVLNGILDNQKLLTKLAQYMSTPEKDIKDTLTAYVNELESATYLGSNINLAVYTKGTLFFRDVVKVAVFDGETEVGNYTNYNDKVIIATEMLFGAPAQIVYAKGETEDNLKLIMADITILEAKIRSLSSGNIDLDLIVNLDDVGLLPFKVELGIKSAYANKTWTGTISLYIVGNVEMDAGGTLDVDIPFSMTKSGPNEIALSFSIDADADIMGYKVDAKLSNTMTITNNIPVAQLDATNAKYYYDLTDDEIASIINKTSNSLSGTTPGTLFESGKGYITEVLINSLDKLIYSETGPLIASDECDYYEYHPAELFTDGERFYTYNKNNTLTPFSPLESFYTNETYPFSFCYHTN